MEQGVEKDKQRVNMRRRRWILLGIAVLVIVIGTSAVFSARYLLDPNIYRDGLQKSLTAALGREVSIGEARINFWRGFGISFEDVRVRDRSLAFDVIQSKRLILRPRLLPLIKREMKWKRIVLDRPTFRVIRDAKGQLNFLSDMPLASKQKETEKKISEVFASLVGVSLSVQDGVIFFSDESMGNPPLKTEVRSFNFRLSRVSYHKAFPFLIEGKLLQSKKEGQFSIHGTIQNILENLEFSKGRVEAEVKMKGMDTLHFWPYLTSMLPMKTVSGILDLNGRFEGEFRGPFKASAEITMKDVLFDYPRVFSFVLKPKWINLHFEAEYDTKDLKIPRLFIELPEIWVKAKGKIYDIGSKQMGMEAEASTSSFDIAEGKKFIPFRIITPDVSDRLFRSEGKGSFRAVSVKLSGRMAEIDHCDQLANAHVLSVEAKLDGATLKLPWEVPPLENLMGRLLFENGHLYVKNAEGSIFHSTLERVKATFFELLQIPTLQIDIQGKLDLKDLASFAKFEGIPEEFSRTLSSLHIDSGVARYSLSAKGVLKPPIRFEHHGVYDLSEIRFTHPKIPFPVRIEEGRVELSQNDLRWTQAMLEFGRSSLRTTGLWKHGEKDHALEVTVKGKVDFKHLFALLQTPLFPEDVRSKTRDFEPLSGTSQISFKGKTLPGISRFSYEGEFLPKEASFLQKGNPVPIVLKEGGVSFSDKGMSFSKAKIQSGSSLLALNGFIRSEDVDLSARGSIDLKQLFSLARSPLFPDQIRSQVEGIQELDGGAEVRLQWLGKTGKWFSALKEGEIRLKGVSLHHREIPVSLSHIEGLFLITPEQVRFDGVRGRVGDSPVTLSGALSRGASLFPMPSGKVEKGPGLADGRRLSFQIFSPQLDLDPLFPKKEGSSPASFEKIRDWLSTWSVDGTVQADRGSYRSLRYQDLTGEMKTIDGTLFIHPFQFKSDGGDFWGEGWVRPTEKGISMEIRPRFSNMEAKAFIRTLFQKGEEEKVIVTGRVHIDKAELKGEGEDFQKLKESLSGGLRFEIENGVIERFNILSKIFSILNVSQLLKGRLPDLKTKGLPFHQIMANFHVKDGVATTDDFLVDSDSMRITLIGKIDLGKNLIDARIGVHPLVTIDAILGNVPIAGYILTGKDKGFISYFYEVKGSLDNPKIEAIPFKIVEETTWGIIKRLLETPLRPFQKAPSFNNKEKSSKEPGVRSSEPKP